MPAFVDTSALLKLYVPEPGAQWMRATVRPQGIVISAITTTEVGASLSRRVRQGELTPRESRLAWQRFRRDSRGFLVLPLNGRRLNEAANLTARSATLLRSLDALQLQAALETRREAQRAGLAAPRFVSADDRLLAAAAAFGFFTENPLDHP